MYYNSAVAALPGAVCDIQDINRACCHPYGTPPEELCRKTRQAAIREPRQIAMFLAYKYLRMKTTEAGRAYGKDHATVIHSTRVVRSLYETDKFFRQRIHQIMAQLGINNMVVYERLELKCKVS